MVFYSCQESEPIPDLEVINSYYEGEVVVKLQENADAKEAFALINELELEAIEVHLPSLQSALPPDSTSYVKEIITDKAYTNWYVTVYYDTRKETIIVPHQQLFNLHVEALQQDWLHTREVLKLSRFFYPDWVQQIDIYFAVPVGSEKRWVDSLQQFSLVDKALLHYHGAPLNPYP